MAYIISIYCQKYDKNAYKIIWYGV